MSVLRFLRDTAVDLCLGCRHDRLTRPFTIQDESYMVCLDCGRQLLFSVEDMRRLSGREVRRMRAAQSGALRVMPAVPVTGTATGPATGPVPVTLVVAGQRESDLAA